MTDPTNRTPLVHYRDETSPLECPFGNVTRVVTGGDGGVANVHVVRVTQGTTHYHAEYDEVYYVLAGRGTLTIERAEHALRPGAVAVIPRRLPHAIAAADGDELEFIIFGVPPMAIDDERARPRT